MPYFYYIKCIYGYIHIKYECYHRDIKYSREGNTMIIIHTTNSKLLPLIAEKQKLQRRTLVKFPVIRLGCAARNLRIKMKNRALKSKQTRNLRICV